MHKQSGQRVREQDEQATDSDRAQTSFLRRLVGCRSGSFPFRLREFPGHRSSQSDLLRAGNGVRGANRSLAAPCTKSRWRQGNGPIAPLNRCQVGTQAEAVKLLAVILSRSQALGSVVPAQTISMP